MQMSIPSIYYYPILLFCCQGASVLFFLYSDVENYSTDNELGQLGERGTFY